MASHQLDTRRDPLDAARVALAFAASERNGLVDRIRRRQFVSEDTVNAVLAKWVHALHEFDRATLACLGAEVVEGRRLITNDTDDLDKAFKSALPRFDQRPSADAGFSQFASAHA